MSPTLHPAEQYARDVTNDRIPACHWAKAACERYHSDVKNAKKLGLVFDRDKAEEAIDFFGLFNHYEGDLVDTPVALEPFQQFIIWNLFGWYRAKNKRWRITDHEGRVEDTAGTRRYRTAYLELSRKNAKTFLASIIGIYMGFADGKSGSNVYAAATKREQARICFETAQNLIRNSAHVKEYSDITVYANNIHSVSSYSKFEPLASESKSLDGLRIHCGVLDEVHAWTNGEVFTKLIRATSADPQPLIFNITTAGSTEESKFCWTLREYTCKVLDKIIADDTWFGIIYTLDEGDDWRDEKVWIKANPGLGTIKKIDFMRTEAKKAAEMPTELNNFLRYDLDVWVRSEAKWMPMEDWRLCAGPIPAAKLPDFLLTRPCYAGLDLASVNDLTALVLNFPPTPEDPLEYILPYFFIPADNIEKRSRNDRVPYDVWADQGFVIPTPGNITDHNYVLHHLGELMGKYNILRLYYDRYGSFKIVEDLQLQYNFTLDETTAKNYRKPLLLQYGQGFLSMSPPMKDVLRLVLLHKFGHGNHPVLTWNMDNLIAALDKAGNIKPDKEKSRERIDGAVALIMAHAGAMIHNPEAQQSVYATRGIITL